jgi:hypothetical protein
MVWGMSWAESSNSDQVPLRFKTEGINLKVEPPQLLWDLRPHEEPIIGGFNFSEDQFSVHLRSVQPQQVEISFHFNAKIFPAADLTVFDSQNKISMIEKIPTGASDIKKSFLTKDGPQSLKGFKACVVAQNKETQNLICSPPWLQDLSFEKTEAAILINDQPQALRGTFNLEPGHSFQLQAELPSGLSLTQKSQAPLTEFYEVTKLDEDTIKVKTYGTEPVANTVNITEPRSEFWQHTVGDQRVFHETQIALAAPFLPVQRKAGFTWVYEIKYSELPEDSRRITLRSKSPHSTYADSVGLTGSKPNSAILKSSDGELISSESSFHWRFPTPKKFFYNSSSIESDLKSEQGNSHTVFDYEIIRMPSTYLAGNLGASLGSDGSLASLYDLQAVHWFNEPFGESYYLSRTRWGILMGAVNSISTSVAKSTYAANNADLAYRLTPGVEAWDESVAITLGVTGVSFASSRTATLVGPGIFWSRSLPTWFDDILGVLPFFRKPKWVNVSAHYYGLSSDSAISGSSVQVRALARIEITQSTFFEVGWGFLTENFSDTSTQKATALSAGRGFLGLGYRF